MAAERCVLKMNNDERMNVSVNLARSVDPSGLLMRELLALYGELSLLRKSLAATRQQSKSYLQQVGQYQLGCAALEGAMDSVADAAFDGRQAALLLSAVREVLSQNVTKIAFWYPADSEARAAFARLCLLLSVSLPAASEAPTDVANPPPADEPPPCTATHQWPGELNPEKCVFYSGHPTVHSDCFGRTWSADGVPSSPE